MFFKQIVLFALLFLTPLAYASQEHSFFDQFEQTESITQPCTCNCHSRVYSYKECAICAHTGGIFHANQSHINIENQDNQGIDHE
jgi:hypothetical protein